MKFTCVRHLSILVLGCIYISSSTLRAERPINFAQEVLPILSDRCFVCHGPDTKKKNLVRLDSYEEAIRDLGGYRAIDPKNLGESELIARIFSEDDPMPPKDAERQLTEYEKDLLKKWVAQGGKYARHWAYELPKKQTLPKIQGQKLQPIDAYVLEQLNKQKAGFAPEADRATLARRVAFVLTGLPPEPAQLEAFLKDNSDKAYSNLVEQLLASPRFGEHQARYWLDAIRYGDTHGLHLDNKRGIYPYRDWVIYALNNNLPLDQFIEWQLAGDLLPNPNLQQRVATGFVRMNPSTSEGGVIPAEFQAKNNFDRTENLGTVLLGMSLICARCHTHKYDPITQKEYYELLAFFNSTSERPLDGNSYTYGPVMKAPSRLQDWMELNNAEQHLEYLLTQAHKLAEGPKQQKILDEAKKRAQLKLHDFKLTQSVDGKAALPQADAFSQLKGLPGKVKQKLEPKGKALWLSFKVKAALKQSFTFTFSGSSKSEVIFSGIKLTQPLSSVPGNNHLQKVSLLVDKGEHEIQVKLVSDKKDVPLELSFKNPWSSLVNKKSWLALSKEEKLALLKEEYGPLAELKAHSSISGLQQKMKDIEGRFTTTLITTELKKPRVTKVLQRGEYHLPVGDVLEPNIPKLFGEFPKGQPRNRLGLARWLTSRENPLVSRVLVNRIWSRVYGEALVRTPEEFGLQGQHPTHPELLDWLAVELQDSKWNLKHMLRLMVHSKTFKQSSKFRTDVRDPENLLYSRGPSYRMDAEVLRDLALWGSELLEAEAGGEGVKPYQPGGMWSALSHPASNTKKYVRDKGKKLYKRSIYVYWKRTSPHPMMTLFDAPSRETSCVRRSRTNTPLQSLGLFNETQRIEMSRKFAERLVKSSKDNNERLNVLFKLVACRTPNDLERAGCNKLIEFMIKRYSNSKEEALALLKTGEVPRDEKLDPVEVAAWSQLVTTILASDVALLLY